MSSTIKSGGLKELEFGGCYRGTISYMERERVPKGRGIVTEGIKVYN